ncbi:MAG: hypothetical protein JST42_04465 [Bacteroidetes bacterium]|nr:hypothetical protein [Bacteroidota bacterium]
MRRVIFFVFVVLSLFFFPSLLWLMGELLLPVQPAAPPDQPVATDIANFFAAVEGVILALPFMVVGYCVFLDIVSWVGMFIAGRTGAREWEKGFRYSLIYSMVLSFFSVIMAGWSVVLRML